MPGRRSSWWLGLLCAAALAAATTGRAAIDAVPEIDDLSARALHAVRPELPLLLVFTADDCVFCVRLAEEVLLPMLRSGEYDERVVIRAVNLSGKAIVGFDGARTDPWTFARRYGVMVTPTLIVVDRRGTPLAKPLVGLGPTEYYELQINAALQEAAAGPPADTSGGAR